jgi:dTDP-glucose 4,6-dehydratase/UDP-glucose 4,6-dehydratase
MKLLVTGGCGFIGSNFINYYFHKNKECSIVNIDAMYYCASEFNINDDIRLSDRYTLFKINLNDYDNLINIIKENNITHIIHFAAQSHVDNSFNDSLQYTYDNVKGTHCLLEAIKNTNLSIVLIHISTDEVYGESINDNDFKTEKSLLLPTNPYAASKAAAEMYVQSYIKSFGLKAIITRGNNVFGTNQYPEKLIPKFIELLKNNKKCTIHGDGSMIRNFIHVDDVCTAIDTILLLGTYGQIYNIGSDEENEISVLKVTEKLVKHIHNDNEYKKYIKFVEDRPFNDKRYFISNQKLKDLGWYQKISFEDGVDRLLKEYNKTNFCFILYSYKNNWYKLYQKIRNKYNNKIILIDSNKTKQIYDKLQNIEIINTEINNILLPFKLYYENKYTNNVVFLNDNIDYNFDYDFDNHDFMIYNKKNKINTLSEKNIIQKINKSFLTLYENNNWCGVKDLFIKCNFDTINNINKNSNILEHIDNMNDNNYINTIENIFGFLLTI